MSNTVKTFFTALVLSLLSTVAISQSQIKRYLVESVQEECSVILGGSQSACSSVSKQNLLNRFELAEIFLVSELESMVLKDQSNYHQRLLNQLAELEAGNTISQGKPMNLQQAKFNTCLLAAVTKPKESALLFRKIIFQAYGLNPDHLTEGDSSASFGFFQHWLFGLLDARFQNKTDAFSKSQYVVQARYVSAESNLPFQGLNNERIMAKKMEQYIRDCDVKHDGESSSKMLTVYYYEQRCAKIQDSQNGYVGDELFKLTDEFFQKALSLEPDNDRIRYNRYTLFYNSAVLVSQQLKSDSLTDSEKEILQQKAANYLATASAMDKDLRTNK